MKTLVHGIYESHVASFLEDCDTPSSLIMRLKCARKPEMRVSVKCARELCDVVGIQNSKLLHP